MTLSEIKERVKGRSGWPMSEIERDLLALAEELETELAEEIKNHASCATNCLAAIERAEAAESEVSRLRAMSEMPRTIQDTFPDDQGERR